MEDEIKKKNRKRAEIWALKSFRDRSGSVREDVIKKNIQEQSEESRKEESEGAAF